jgi:hypothetical protein
MTWVLAALLLMLAMPFVLWPLVRRRGEGATGDR